jgi:hypothetical protein
MSGIHPKKWVPRLIQFGLFFNILNKKSSLLSTKLKENVFSSTIQKISAEKI